MKKLLERDVLSQNEVKEFFDSLIAVCVVNAEGTLVFGNEAFSRLTDQKKSSDLKWCSQWREIAQQIREHHKWEGICETVRKDGSSCHLKACGKQNSTGDFIFLCQDITSIIESSKEIERKNTYLEHAAKILRHDMYSGINTYIPRGLSSLERRISLEKLSEMKIDAPLKMIKEGLRHTQKVFKGVYAFTNLVKKNSTLEKNVCNLQSILEDYLSSTSYRPQVILENLGEFSVNEPLFCTAIDNLIRNGLKYNDSLKKEVKIRREGEFLLVEDNGRGMTSDEFKELSQPYTRKTDQKESGSGLGLNICVAIIEEHKFKISCEKLFPHGTQIKIQLI